MSQVTEGIRAPSTSTGELGYLPALDGLRGACLLAVLLFHSGFTWLSGGFLGVSTFFTLSGFLITTLLLAEQQSRGSISLRRFWGRRMRRLLPAAILTVAAIVASAPRWLPAAQRERLAEDALATLFYVVNWRFVSAAYAYNLIFVDPSPLQHFWSLAIEGQFYLLFPLVVGLLLKLGGRLRALAVVCGVLAVASLAVGWTVTSVDEAQHRLYYGTDARAAELLIGALLAIALRAGVRFDHGRTARALDVLGPLAALAVVVAWSRASVGDGWLYHGGFVAYACLSALLIAAAVRPDGIVRRVLAAGWLRWIGTISYGAYLFHWPLFLFLTAERTGLGPLPLLVVRLAVTLGLADLSYRFVERPIRRGRLLPRPWFAWTTGVALLLVSALAIASNPVRVLVLGVEGVYAARRLVAGESATGALRFAIYGDSTAQALANGLAPWLRDDGKSLPVGGFTTMGCGLFVYGEIEKRGRWQAENDVCQGMAEQWRQATSRSKPDVAIVLVGPWEVRNRRLTPQSPRVAMGDPALDAATRDAIVAAVDALTAAGSSVVWLTSPHVRIPPLNGKLFDEDRAASDPARIDRFNALVREVARTRPEQMRVVEFGAYLEAWPGGEFDEKIRADGVHFSVEGGSTLARTWLGPQILRAASELRTGGREQRR